MPPQSRGLHLYVAGILLFLLGRCSPTSSGLGPDVDNVIDFEDIEDQELLAIIQNEILEAASVDAEYNRELLATLPHPQHITYPLQVRRGQVLDLDTHDVDARHRKMHYRHTAFEMTFFGKKVKLKLENNREMLSQGLRQKVNSDPNTQLIHESPTEGCYYQGIVRKEAKSLVAISTCSGIRGLIVIGEESYVIQPLTMITENNQTRFPHVVYPTQPAEDKTCGNERGMWSRYQESHKAEFLRSIKLANVQPGTRQLLDQTRYLHLGLVCDHSLYKHLNGSLSTAVAYLLEVVNIVDMYMRPAGFRVRLVYVEVWNTHNQVALYEDVREQLTRFMEYRQDSVDGDNPELAPSASPHIVHLLTKNEFSAGELGMAVPDSICTNRAVSVSEVGLLEDPQQASSTMAHMIGHTLGLTHEPASCSCSDPEGCLMASAPLGVNGSHPQELGSCSQEDLSVAIRSHLLDCLLPQPTKPTFVESCGNGIIERGEECDCRTAEECAETDPCCDPSTCLMKTWATCRRGDCCNNCTVMPSTEMCRGPSSECDVPEYCTGTTGQCPTDVIVQNGWTCARGDSYCFNGQCNTYAAQCAAIWGTQATPADDRCYQRFNPTGTINGHCGINSTTGNYIPCRQHDIKCGLLHCAGGDEEPLMGLDFSATRVMADGINYQCKILNGLWDQSLAPYGLVSDGTRCANGGICQRSRCTPVGAMLIHSCLRGQNGSPCSGNGVCTSLFQCYCDDGYKGHTCEMKTNFTATPSPSPAPPGTTPAAVPGVPVYHVPTPPQEHRQDTKPPSSPVTIDTTVTAVEVNEKRQKTTMWLVIVLAGVVGGACCILGFCTLCYRRRSPRAMKKAHKKKQAQLIKMSKLNTSLQNHPGVDDSSRLVSIKFGNNLPSYRAEKLRKALKKSLGGQSETESEHSRGDRDSTEVKVPQTLPLSQPPEKGILKKKYPHSLEDLTESSASERQPLHKSKESLHRSKENLHKSKEKKKRLTSSTGQLRSPLQLTHDTSWLRPLQEANRLKSPAYLEFRSMVPLPPSRDVGTQGDMDEEEGIYEELCGSSCSSLDKKEYSDEDNEATGEQADSAKAFSEMSYEMPRDSSNDSLEGARNRIIKLKNINELLKQIDEQFNSVLQQTTQGDYSPTGSEELRGSETEADRHYNRDSFYKQSDIEEGYSPPHRSPLLSPNPMGSDKRSSMVSTSDKRNSQLTSCSSPEPLPSPTGILSPIRHRSPPRFMSPIQEGMRLPSHSSPLSSPSQQSVNSQAQRRADISGSPKRDSPARRSSPSRIPVRRGVSPSREGRGSRPGSTSPTECGGRVCSPAGHRTRHTSGSPGRHMTPTSSHTSLMEPPVTAVPYRGAKTGDTGSVPASPPVSRREDSALPPSPQCQRAHSIDSPPPGSPHPLHKPRADHLGSPKRTPSKVKGAEAANRHCSSPEGNNGKSSPAATGKAGNPLLSELFPVQRRSLSTDGQSISEGYHSDRADSDSIIVRELPVERSDQLRATPHKRISYTKQADTDDLVNV